jgi:hypothetical protein
VVLVQGSERYSEWLGAKYGKTVSQRDHCGKLILSPKTLFWEY